MNSDNNYSSFVEHSFRRLSLLIRQQDIVNTLDATSHKKTPGQTLGTTLLVNTNENNFTNSSSISFSSEVEAFQQSIDENPNHTNGINFKSSPIAKPNRVFMRPPKTRTSNNILAKLLLL